MNISQNYDRFYKGAEPLKSYGSGGDGLTPKDTLVKYELSTTDEHGNKIMEPLTKEEALQAMKDISGQYGGHVLVMFSGDGLQALSESLKSQIRKGCLELTEEEKAENAGKQELLDQSIVHLENTHRLIIPHIQTNEKLNNSLENAPEHIVKASNGIIRNYLLPPNVSGMTEEQRKDAIALGLEEARYLAENYLDETHAQDYMSAMETIARFGINGKVSEDGSIAYHIKKGPLAGAPDDYVTESDILKENFPELYNELQKLNQCIAKGDTGWGSKFIDLHNRIRHKLSGYSGTVSQGKQLTYYETAASEYISWKTATEDTKLPESYNNINYSNINSFFNSLKSQGSLDEGWLAEAQKRFEKWIISE